MVVVLVFGLGISILVGHTILTEFHDQTNPDGEVNQTYVARGLTAIQTFNNIFIVLVIGLIGATLIGAYMINTHPAIFIISIILLSIVVIISIPFANAFYEFTQEGAMANATNSMATMSTVIFYLPEIIAILGVILAVIIYAKFGGLSERY